ncbi:protein lsr2 precursor [Luteimicrobium album]|uniref:Protein lsr2 n=1 Tax=Luteimicrobium album TaxID=1054550 RepID=A0ABQ6HZF3_9MICO|nr:Lsr2 family protein [Luteimicrobium album]GMA22905.1 protein lsr2 precursor [Luteimicrobium album]
MAQKVQVLLVDDLDGGTAEQTVTFALDGVSYEIDLNDKHAAELREALATWIGHARKVTGRAAARPARRSARGGASEATQVREWARANGFTVSDRGRIPADVKAKYDAAH